MNVTAEAIEEIALEKKEASTSFPPQAYSWYVVVLMMLFYVLSFMDRQIIAVLLEPIKQELLLTDVQISLLGGLSFVLFYAVAGIFIGRLADSMHRPFLIGLGVFLWSFTTAFCGFASQFWHLLILRMGVGLGESALLPSTLSLISDYFPRRRLAIATSVFLLGAPIGIGLAFAGGGYLYGVALELTALSEWETVPFFGELSAWKLVLFFLGATGMLMTALLVTVKEPRRKSQRRSGKAKIAIDQEAASLDVVKAYFWEHWKIIGGLFLGMSFISLSSYSQGFWDITFLSRTYGWDPASGSMWYGAVQMSGGIIGVLCGGYFADKMGERGIKGASFIMIVVGAAVALICGLIYPLMPNANSSMVMMIPTILGNTIPYGCAAATIQMIFPSNMRGLAAGIYFFMSNAIGIGIGPTAVAFLTDYVFNDTQMVRFSLLSVCSVARASAFLLVLIALGAYRKSRLSAGTN